MSCLRCASQITFAPQLCAQTDGQTVVALAADEDKFSAELRSAPPADEKPIDDAGTEAAKNKPKGEGGSVDKKPGDEKKAEKSGTVSRPMKSDVDVKPIASEVQLDDAGLVTFDLKRQPSEGVKMLFRNWCMSIGGGERR